MDTGGGREGDWMQTYTGVQFWPMDPRVEEVRIKDIAHSLSLQCRFAGHCREFYSVAQHSVRVAWLVRDVDPAAALAGLLHDAAEAYLVDLPYPIKHSSALGSIYRTTERHLERVIAVAFDLPLASPELVHRMDAALLAAELRDLMGPQPERPVRILPPAPPEVIVPWGPQTAETNFLAAFEEFSGWRL